LFVEQTIDTRIEQALPLLAKIQQGLDMKEAKIFESWIDNLAEGTWNLPETPEQLDKLKTMMASELIVGPDAINATEQLYDLVGDDILFDRLSELAAKDPRANAWNDTEVMNRLAELGIEMPEPSEPGNPAEPATAPVAPVAAAPAAPVPVAEGWKDEADDFNEWSDYVRERLTKASPEQRLGLAKQLSQVEVRNFGSSIQGGFNKQTGKPQAGLGLTDTVRSIMRSFGKEADDTRKAQAAIDGTDGPAGNFSMPFGSVDVAGLEDASPEVIRVMKKAVMLGADVAAAARNFYKKNGTLTDQDLPKIQMSLANNASAEWNKQHSMAESMGRGVDAKGRTQSQWIQMVKAKFPDGKMIQAKMPDGPVQVTLPDGRKLGWKKVEQAVTEGPAVDAYMSGKSPALAHFADQLDKSTEQGMTESTELNTMLKYAGVPVAESRVLDEAGETIDHILNRFKHEVGQFEQGNDLDSDLYDALFDYYSDKGEIPYGIAKARTGDPFSWVSDKLANHLGVNEGWKGAIAGGLAGGALGSVVPALGTLAGAAAGAYAGHKLGDQGFKDPDAEYKKAQKLKQTPPVDEADAISTFEVMSGFDAPVAEGSCNMTAEGAYCPEHGLAECGGGMYESREGDAMLARIKSLAMLK